MLDNTNIENQNQTNNFPKCPKCHEKLLSVRYIEYGVKKWSDQGWEESTTHDAEWYTECCDTLLEYEDLENLGIFT